MGKKINSRTLLFICAFVLIMGTGNELKSQIQIGVFADCQYCNCEPAGKRYYQNSLSKLRECCDLFSKNKNMDFVVGLGDFIDRDLNSFDSVNVILKQAGKDFYPVIGNHDFEVDSKDFDKVQQKLGLKNTYYSFEKEGWKFIFLNGNEITFQSNNPEIVRQAEELTSKLQNENKPNYAKWNGGIGETQLNWLSDELQKAEENHLKVVVFCHYPLLPLEAHTLWNSDQVLPVLEKYSCVKAWINGHNHAGNYAIKNGIHFINLKGMVDTETENAFSILSLSNQTIDIEGFGREKSLSLPLKQ